MSIWTQNTVQQIQLSELLDKLEQLRVPFEAFPTGNSITIMKAFDYHDIDCSDSDSVRVAAVITFCWHSTGSECVRLQQDQAGQEAYERALEIYGVLRDSFTTDFRFARGHVNALVGLCCAQYCQGYFYEAEKTVNEALQMICLIPSWSSVDYDMISGDLKAVDKDSHKWLKNSVYNALSEIYENTGRPELALQYRAKLE